MQVSTRSYLMAGMSFAAVGAIIATPMGPPVPKQELSHRLVGYQQVHLAALTAPISVHNPARNPQAVHVLADVSRALQAVKAAHATSTIGGTSASPSGARTTVPRLAAAAAAPTLAKAVQIGAATSNIIHQRDRAAARAHCRDARHGFRKPEVDRSGKRWAAKAAALRRVSERMCKQVSVSLPYRGDSHDEQLYDYTGITGSITC